MPRRPAPGPKKRPIRDSNPSHLVDNQAATPAASQGIRVSGGSCTRLSTMAKWCLGCSATDTYSKDGRSRTLDSGFGDRLLTQEHVPDIELPRQDSNLHPSR